MKVKELREVLEFMEQEAEVYIEPNFLKLSHLHLVSLERGCIEMAKLPNIDPDKLSCVLRVPSWE